MSHELRRTDAMKMSMRPVSSMLADAGDALDDGGVFAVRIPLVDKS